VVRPLVVVLRGQFAHVLTSPPRACRLAVVLFFAVPLLAFFIKHVVMARCVPAQRGVSACARCC
jgi:hypothetical protein